MSPGCPQAQRPVNKASPAAGRKRGPGKFEVYGEEMVEKTVTKSSKSGRVYLPQDWIGKRVKIILVSK